jgi:nucleoside-diphosphate-sugar epimerase
MAEVVNVDPDIDYRPERPDEIDDFYADMTKCEDLFGHTPDTGFREGLEHTFEWMTSNPEININD